MFRIKQYIKMLLQNILLPLVYECFRHAPVRRGSVIFADAHHDEMPFSMRRMYERLQGEMKAAGTESAEMKAAGTERAEMKAAGTESAEMKAAGTESAEMKAAEIESAGMKAAETEKTHENENGQYQIEAFICDFGKLSFGKMVLFLLRFMKQYATAEYVFICDYFLPVASCKKRPETKVVQLWHSCGLMKKIAFDAQEDIPKNYKGNMFGNYSYLTMSAEICVPVHARALRLSPEHIRATGISRTDYYFDDKWNQKCREKFEQLYPQAKGKKIALWAPTFRGNAAQPRLEGLEEIKAAALALADDWYFVIKAHPHVDAHGKISNCELPTEELYPVADVLITDYSSVLFDYLLYQKPAVLFAPDLAQYETSRGFYLDYKTIPYPHTTTADELTKAVRDCADWERVHENEIAEFRQLYTGACDGASTDRICEWIGMVKKLIKSVEIGISR